MRKSIDDYLVKLSDTDTLILESYESLCGCLNEYLGGGYEIVLHSLGSDDFFIKKIINGHYSDRTEGRALKDYPVKAIEHLYEKLQNDQPVVSVYFSENSKGEIFKSSTIGIIGENNRIIGMLCLNFFLNTPFSELVAQFYPPNDVILKKNHLDAYEQEDSSYEQIITKAVNEAKTAVEQDAGIPLKYKNKEIIRRLEQTGVFKIKESVVVCAGLLNISATTIYMHLRNLSE